MRPHREAPKPQAAQERADAALGQPHAKPRLDHLREVGPAPADNAVLSQVRTGSHQLGHRRVLFGR
jgi:hypothetical protein